MLPYMMRYMRSTAFCWGRFGSAWGGGGHLQHGVLHVAGLATSGGLWGVGRFAGFVIGFVGFVWEFVGMKTAATGKGAAQPSLNLSICVRTEFL
jgi:hypothetical protein